MSNLFQWGIFKTKPNNMNVIEVITAYLFNHFIARNRLMWLFLYMTA